MNENSNSINIIPDFDQFLKIIEFIPHYLYLEKSSDDKKYFINSTLNCLTNMKSFIEYLSNFYSNNSSDYRYKLIEKIKDIFDFVKENKNKEDIKYKPDFLTEVILNKIKLFKNISNHDPRLLIDNILNIWLNGNNKDEQESHLLNSLNFLNIDDNSYEVLNKSSSESNTKPKDINEIAKINIVIKNNQVCPNLNCKKTNYFYKSFSTFHFYLMPNLEKEYTLIDCFNDFLKKENEETEYICEFCSNIFKNKSDCLFYQLPEQLIILIYYENIIKNYEKFFYSFEEILDFSNCKYIDKNVKYKKYFLSSFILCKYPKDEKEYFYTFCRKDKDSSFLIYNNNEKKVREHGKVIKRQTKRLKNDQFDKRQSFPYVLIYTAYEN